MSIIELSESYEDPESERSFKNFELNTSGEGILQKNDEGKEEKSKKERKKENQPKKKTGINGVSKKGKIGKKTKGKKGQKKKTPSKESQKNGRIVSFTKKNQRKGRWQKGYFPKLSKPSQLMIDDEKASGREIAMTSMDNEPFENETSVSNPVNVAERVALSRAILNLTTAYQMLRLK